MAAALVAATCVACDGSASGDMSGEDAARESGAVRVPNNHVAYVPASEFPVGTVFTDGLERLYPADGGAPVTITDLEWVGSQEAGQVIGWKLAGPGRRVGALQVIDGFPPNERRLGSLTDAIGATISDTKVGHELLVGIEVVSDEYAVREGLRVITEHNGRTYEDVLPAVLVFCGADLTEEACVERYEAEHD